MALADAVGAGDAFAAGVLDGELDGAVVAESLRRADLCGAYTVSAVGDTTAMPTREELDADRVSR